MIIARHRGLKVVSTLAALDLAAGHRLIDWQIMFDRLRARGKMPKVRNVEMGNGRLAKGQAESGYINKRRCHGSAFRRPPRPDRRVPGAYFASATLMLLPFLSFSEISNLHAFNIALSSIPTAPTKPICFLQLAAAISNKTRLSNN